MTSADFWRARSRLRVFALTFGQALLSGTLSRDPGIRRLTFTAQAPDLPMRIFEDGFVMMGSLASLYRVSVRSLAALTRRWLTAILYQNTGTFAGFLPPVDRSRSRSASVTAVALA